MTDASSNGSSSPAPPGNTHEQLPVQPVSQLIERAGICTFTWTVGDVCMRVGDCMASIIGLPVELGNSVTIRRVLKQVDRRDRNNLVRRLNMLHAKQRFVKISARCYFARDTSRYFDLHTSFECNADGSPGTLYGVVVEAQQKALNGPYRSSVASALANSRDQQNQFLMLLAHELRNPLAPIQQVVDQLCEQQVVPSDDFEQLRMIARQTRQLAYTIDDLLEIGRVVSQQLKPIFGATSVEQILLKVVADTKEQLDDFGHTLHLDLSSEPIFIFADKNQLIHALTNLLRDVSQNTPQNGRIAISNEVEGGLISITLQDVSGLDTIPLPQIEPQFDEEFSDHVSRRFTFDESQQVEAGVSISLATELIAIHAGKLQRCSNNGYKVVLPQKYDSIKNPQVKVMSRNARRDREELLKWSTDLTSSWLPKTQNAEFHNIPDASVPKVESKRVLVVEDSPDIAESLGRLLRRKKWSVEIAYSGQQALEAVDELKPDIILLDIGLPDISGLEVARILRTREEFEKSLTLIALTGWGNAEHQRETKLAGFDYHLTKPVSSAELLSVLDSFR